MSECHDRSGPPEDGCRRYATLSRIGSDGRAAQVRVGVSEFKGAEYLSVATWHEDGEGRWWPAQRGGINIRRGEVLELLKAVSRIAVDMKLLPPDEPPATEWLHYGGDGGPGRGPRPATPDTQLFAGQGRRRVDLSEACRSAAFQMLTSPKREDD